MAFIDNYQYENYSKAFEVADGDHIVVIAGAQVRASLKSGKQMLEISFMVPDAGNSLYIERYVEGDYFNQNMSKFFDAFGIQPGNFQFQTWAKKSGMGHFIHKDETFIDKQGVQKTVNKCRMQYLLVPEKEQFPEDIPYQQEAPARAQQQTQPKRQPQSMQQAQPAENYPLW